ncbi:MAG: hypothetical protein KUG69_03415 [Marinosulfonomonas sp.]|nr:hypothetical protein [Marinosulfonomonas sp.]
MAVSKARLFLFLSAALFLGACGQLFSTSAVYIDDALLTDQLRKELIDKVYEKAELLGGECKLLNRQRQYHHCPLKAGDPSFLRLSIGYDPKGSYGIYVDSSVGVWLPKSAQQVTSGKFIGETQKDLESWMRSIVPDEIVIRAERSYSNHDITQSF